MKTIKLGDSGLNVTKLWLGAMMFGLRADAAESGRIVAMAREAGVNAIDTADVYVNGESERLTGELIAADRGRWIVATKVAGVMGADPNCSGLSRRWIMQAADNSLRRLGTDWIDLYYLHRDDMETPLEETVAAMGDLIRSGKIRYFGLSNFRAWRMARVAELCRAMGVPPPIAVQPPYSAVTRGIETEIIPCANAYGMGVVCYSPLARGVLTAKYAGGAAPDPDSRAGRADKRMMETEFRPESLAVAAQLKSHAEATGRSAVDFAIGWVLANRNISGVIAGPRNAAQMKSYIGALAAKLSAEDEALVNSLVPAGHSSTPGYIDPADPVAGRAS